MSRNDWTELFGSDDEQYDIKQPIITFETIPGLKLIRQGLDHEQQMALVHALADRNYFSGPDNNQAMIFGKLPSFIDWICPWIIQNYPDLFHADILNREPLFDQAILNMYKKGEGITSHVDLLRFEDGIIIISLLSSCVMKMRPARSKATSYAIPNHAPSYDILLRPGDILALSKEARYNWEHGIDHTTMDEYNGEYIQRNTRISVTLRKLVHTNHESEVSLGTR
ncbi:uncharacterized protein B0P05DRAFT_582718 [Gilbertella persicaria]|uniref:uncharacterized protein n=1 Tax=Gilbertella persicaria TaxID=101096 RepID=UPI002220322C|nr:uncharacterized protein B0P05DRAFT_582718 [Gilbertella persicaria]KAI8098383.1 hypothetical protein B0P05DRAFT_582718 [Gilbertella persicaria]